MDLDGFSEEAGRRHHYKTGYHEPIENMTHQEWSHFAIFQWESVLNDLTCIIKHYKHEISPFQFWLRCILSAVEQLFLVLIKGTFLNRLGFILNCWTQPWISCGCSIFEHRLGIPLQRSCVLTALPQQKWRFLRDDIFYVTIPTRPAKFQQWVWRHVTWLRYVTMESISRSSNSTLGATSRAKSFLSWNLIIRDLALQFWYILIVFLCELWFSYFLKLHEHHELRDFKPTWRHL